MKIDVYKYQYPKKTWFGTDRNIIIGDNPGIGKIIGF